MNEKRNTPRRRRWIVVLLVLLPLWLVISSGIGLWMWFEKQRSPELTEPAKFATRVETERLADDLDKLVRIVGPRNPGGEDPARGLTRAAAMIEGALGGSNAGYRIEKLPGPQTEQGSWPTLIATLPGEGRGLWVVTGYDSAPDAGGVEANATGVVSVVAAARAVAADQDGRPVNFAFVPHAYARDSPWEATLERLAGRIGDDGPVLVVESMGASGRLLISMRELAGLKVSVFAGHGTLIDAAAVGLDDGRDLASVLFEMGLPAVRVATRSVVGAIKKDDELPDPEEHAAATRALVGLIRALAR